MKERNVDPHTLGIATATFYKDWQPLHEGQQRKHEDVVGIRGDLAMKTLNKATEQGFQVTVVDNPESSPAFKAKLDELRESNELYVYQENAESTMSAGRRQALRETSNFPGVKTIAWIEPEKTSMVDSLLIAAQPIVSGEAHIVVPQRNPEIFRRTYPDFQVEYEERANERYNNLLKRTGLRSQEAPPLDAWFGPRLLRNDPKVLEHFMLEHTFAGEERQTFDGINPELWPDTLFLSLPSALNAGLTVQSVPVDYYHPAEQTASENNNPAMEKKRQLQYKTIIFSTAEWLKAKAFDQSEENIAAHPSKRSRLRRI